MVRLRLYETLSLLPPNILEFFFAHLPNINQTPGETKKYNKFTNLLQMLVAEFTLTENPANTTNSLLRQLCHADDSIVLGTWLQETDHRTIEDQVSAANLFHIEGIFYSIFSNYNLYTHHTSTTKQKKNVFRWNRVVGQTTNT